MEIRTKMILGILGLVAFVGICIAGGSFVIINPGERGVIVRWGEVSDRVMTSGLNFKTPFVDNVDRMNVQVQKYEAPPEEAASRDMQFVRTSVTINYRLNPLGVRTVRNELGVYDSEVYQTNALHPALRDSIKSVTAKYEADELLANRAKIRREMQDELQNRLDNIVKDGFMVIELSITNFNFSQSFNEAIEAKVEAQQSALRVENQVRQAKAEAEKRVAQAEGEAQSVRLAAQAEADSIRLRAQAEAESITLRAEAFRNNPEVLKLDFVRTWDGRLPLIIGGEPSGFMLGIGNIADISSANR